MDESAHTVLLRLFRELPDPRQIGKVVHKLHDILVIVVCATLSGLDCFTEFEDYAEANEDWFREFLDLPNGIPSHDTFGNVLAALDPEAFERCLRAWFAVLAGTTEGKHIAIDGKTLRHSFDTASNKAAIHLINAYAHENHAIFAQLKTEEKSNEITAVPRLLATLKLKDATVTIDAMGCQTEIARKIIEKKGHYVLAVKGNQSSLHEDIKTYLDDAIEHGFSGKHDVYECAEKNHGRIEVRRCWTCGDVEWLTPRHDFAGLKSIAAVECARTIKGKTSLERRYFISSHSGLCAQKIAMLVRNHWKIENQVHWIMDVCFNEDSCRIRSQNAAENIARLRRVGLMLLKNEKSCKLGIKTKRRKAGYQRDYLLKVLGFNPKE
jgi:predicted transposase YbfD/YdcC